MRPETIAAIDAAIVKHSDEQSPTWILHLAHVAIGRAGDHRARADQDFYTLRAIAYMVRYLERESSPAEQTGHGCV